MCQRCKDKNRNSTGDGSVDQKQNGMKTVLCESPSVVLDFAGSTGQEQVAFSVGTKVSEED